MGIPKGSWGNIHGKIGKSFKEIREGKIHGNLRPVQTLFETRSTVSPGENLERS
jgi:hypothetical protein